MYRNDNSPANSEVGADSYWPAVRPEEGDEGGKGLSVGDYIGTLFASKFIILLSILVLAALVGGVQYLEPPKYRTGALVYVGEGSPARSILSDRSSGNGFSRRDTIAVEIERLKSREQMARVVRRLDLHYEVQPLYYPQIGEAYARYFGGNTPQSPPLPLNRFNRYAWGGERIELGQVQAPEDWSSFRVHLVAGQGNRYRIQTPDGTELGRGRVGETAAAVFPNGGELRLEVRRLEARPGTHFQLIRRSVDNVARELRSRVDIREKSRDSRSYMNSTGLLTVSYAGTDPERITRIVNAIADQYARLNLEQQSADIEKSLEFVNAQQNEMRAKLSEAEEQLNTYKREIGTILDIDRQVQMTVDELVSVEQNLSRLRIEKQELSSTLTEQHPRIQSINRKISRLEQQKQALDQRIGQLPERERRFVELKRDVRVFRELFLLLLNKRQELQISKAGITGNVSIINEARVPGRPFAPKPRDALVQGGVIGLLIGIGIAVVRRLMDRRIFTAEEVEERYGLPVYGVVPHSSTQDLVTREIALESIAERRQRRTRRRGRAAEPKETQDTASEGKLAERALALRDTRDLSVETLRNLRTSVQFSLLETGRKTVVIGSLSPDVGKSFISVNLAILLAQAGKNVLLVDGDIRRGRLRRYFGLPQGPGLTEWIRDEVDRAGCTHQPEEVPNFSFIASGAYPPNPAELLSSERFQNIMAELEATYDVVVIDSAPLMAVSDGLLVSGQAGTLFFVLRAERHTHDELKNALARLHQNRIRLSGFVLNDVPIRRRNYGYGYKYGYGYRYSRYYTYEYDNRSQSGSKRSGRGGRTRSEPTESAAD